jgi:hypothetical protein
MHLTKQALSCLPASLRQQDESTVEITYTAEEVQRLTGGHRIGGLGPADLIKPRNNGLTSAEEHAIWLKDISHWQGEYQALLDDLERVREFIIENGDALREHAEALAEVIAEHDAITVELEVPKARHLRARRAHEQMEEHHHQIGPKLWTVARAIKEVLESVPQIPRPGAME